MEEDYYEYDMGNIDDEDRPFMIVDTDTGRIFDTRNDTHVSKVTEESTKSIATSNDVRKSMVSAWGDWWDEKKKINHDFLRATESGDLEKVKKYLNNEVMLGQAAELNFTGLHDWTALHYAADNERVDVAFELL